MPQAFIAAPILLAATFLLAALVKWRKPESLLDSARGLGMPLWLQSPIRLLPGLEIGLALGLLLTPWWQGFVSFAAISLGLMLCYTAVIARGLGMNPRPSCGCFGKVGAAINVGTLLRNLLLTGLALLGLCWGLTQNSVPIALIAGGIGVWAWLLLLAAATLLTYWIVSERSSQQQLAFSPTVLPASDTQGDDEDYLRHPIPALMLLEGSQPVTLTRLAKNQAVLLVWVTCGCSRSFEAMELVEQWQQSMPVIAVRPVSTLSAKVTGQLFPGDQDWLFDLDSQVMRSFGIQRDPAAVLLGADGLLAGGPVVGLNEVREFGEQIHSQLTMAEA